VSSIQERSASSEEPLLKYPTMGSPEDAIDIGDAR